MKNILEYTIAAAMSVLALASCEEMENYQTTIDAAPKLAYVNPKGGDTFSTLIVHRPTGSTGSFHTEFQANCNSTAHPEASVTVAYDESLVSAYNEKHGTSYVPLPEEYLKLTNASVVIPADTTASRDTVKIDLDTEKDLSKLTERTYLAPFKLVTDGLKASEQMGNLWFIVNTETNIIRPITKAGDLVGFPASGTSEWTADCGDYANLFDGNTGTSATFESENVVTIDMKKEIMVTGLKLDAYAIGSMSIEYSVDGLEWSQAGTPASGEFVSGGSNWSSGEWCAAVYDYFTARYLRLTFSMTGNTKRINEIEVYMIESTDPTLYTQTGVDNVVTGKIVHKKGKGSSSTFSSSFKVYTTISSESGYSATAVVDNSLISAYNTKHGTSYVALPSGNIDLQNTAIAIAAGDNSAADDVRIALKGDLSGLTDENGYLVPVRISATGVKVSETRGVVYAVIKSETNVIRAINSESEIVGFQASGRSSWSADCGDGANLFDGNNNSAVYLSQTGNTVTMSIGGKHLVTGLYFYTYKLANLNVEYSIDGNNWVSAGTAEDSEIVYTGSSWGAGAYYVAFADYLEASYLRLSFDFSSYYARIFEFNVYEIESTEPTIYTICGNDNVFSGKITQHIIAGPISSVSASFNAMTTVSSPSGYSVTAEVDNSYVSAYNRAHGKNYAALDASYVSISGSPCAIAAGANASEGQINVSLTGDLSKCRNKSGYVIPVKLSAGGAVTSTGRGVVYITVDVEESDALFQSGFSVSSIAGTQVADRSAWKIVECDEGGIHSGAYANLFDGDLNSYIRTWGGPVSFTVDLGKEYDVTGFVITARNGYNSHQPNSIYVEGGLDADNLEELGTASKSDGTLVAANPSSYVSFYGTKTLRYLKINASYGSNMGTGEFNIYAK